MLKRILFTSLLLAFLGIINCSAQSTFNILVEDTLYDHQIHDAVELSSGNIIIVDIKNLEPPDFCSRLLKINSNGSVLLQKDIKYSGYPSGLLSIVQRSDNELILCGVVMENGISKLWLCVLDSSLNLVNNFFYSLNGYKLQMSKIKSVSNNELICFGTIQDTSMYQTPFTFMYRFSSSFDSLQFKLFDDHWSLCQDLVERNDFKGYYLVVLGFNGAGDPGKIISLDLSFQVKKTVVMPNVMNLSCLKYSDNSHLIVTGEYSYNWPVNNRRDIGVLKYDTLLNLINSNAFGKSDTEDFPGLQNNLDLTNVHSIFIGGTSNMGPDEFLTQDSWYILNNIDTSLNLNWQRYYGGDGYYTLYGVLATHDGGCLMYGTFWDYHNTQKYVRYLSLIKVDKNGILLGFDGKPSPLLQNVILYPNPGNDWVNVMTQLPNICIEFFDIAGKTMLKRPLSPGLTLIETLGLNSGMYIYRVFSNTKMIQTGKWIKE